MENSVDQNASAKSLFVPMMAIILGMFMVILDSTVINVALKDITEEFNSVIPTMRWTITGYTLALAAVIPLAGWLMDRFGAKRIFLITIGLFTMGSALCAIATSPNELILFRIIQGIGGGMVAPIGMAMVFRIAPPEKIGAIMGSLGVPMLLAPAFGPVVAGYILEYATWPWIFIINIPVGVLTLFVGVKYLPNFKRSAVPSLDILGMILAPIAFSMLAFGVSESANGWSETKTIVGMSVGTIALILFIIVELRQKNPLLELRVFKSSGFTLGVMTTWVMQFALFGLFTIVPLFLQYAKGYTALETGWIMLPQALASGIMMPISGKLYDKIGARPLGVIGLSIITTGMFLFSTIEISTSVTKVVFCLILMGMGMGISMMAINTHVLQSAPKNLVSRVTSLTTAAQQVVVSFAVAGMTSFLASRIETNTVEMQNSNPLPALVESYGETFLLATFVAVAGIILAFTLKRPKPQASEEGTNDKMNMMMSGH